MPFSVKAYHADHPLTVTKETAKEAFAKAVEWHVIERFSNVSISDDVRTYSIEEFAYGNGAAGDCDHRGERRRRSQRLKAEEK